jgi:hypothetical protein
MARFQFSHIETYARTASTLSKSSSVKTCYDILAEASRVYEHSRHVMSPSPPELLDGITTQELAENLNLLLENEATEVVLGGKAKKRAVRKDAHVLLAAVYSYPSQSQMCDLDEIRPFFMDCIEFHREKFGSVQSAVLHTDEQYLHIHVYTVSNNARKLHPGHIAKKLNKSEASSIKSSVAYKNAMRAFQDDFYQSVSHKYGLERIGPMRKRIQSELYQIAKQAKASELAEWIENEMIKKKKKLQDEAERIKQFYDEKRFEVESEYKQFKETNDVSIQELQEKTQLAETEYEDLINQREMIFDILIKNQELISENENYKKRLHEYEEDYGPR